MGEEIEKEFRLDRDSAADFLRDIAGSLEEDESLNLEGENWKIHQPIGDDVPLRVFSGEDGLEIGLKIN
ncbi:MAG: amphi-Trp domain-containing protein [Candidatus Nanohaloarchaea archaeon]